MVWPASTVPPAPTASSVALPPSLCPTQAVDPKSLLYLFGMQLDHSSALIGGGFKFCEWCDQRGALLVSSVPLACREHAAAVHGRPPCSTHPAPPPPSSCSQPQRHGFLRLRIVVRRLRAKS